MTDIDMKEFQNFTPPNMQNIHIKRFDSESYLVQKNFRYYKVSEKIAFLINMMNGDNSIEYIRKNYNNKFNEALTDAELFDIFTKKIQTIFMNKEKENTTPSYLKLSKIIMNEEQVNIFSSPLKILFSKPIAILLAILFLYGIVFYSLNWQPIQIELKRSSVTTVPYVFVFLLISTVFHELGHASACKFYRIRHGGIGIGFYLITPVMFADVTSAWELPTKSRLVVNFGGIYFEMIFITILLIIYCFTGWNVINVISVTILLKLLYNLNPFFRTDGYWMLSDLLNISNLRKKSNDALRNSLRQGRGLIRYIIKNWILLLYSIISLCLLLLFFYYVAFFNIKSLILLPYNVYKILTDIFLGTNFSVEALSKSSHDILISIAFYYLVLIKMLIPFFKSKLGKKPKTIGG